MKTFIFTLVAAWLPIAPPLFAMDDHPAIHGMLIFGKDKIYISHLPMFHSPHDYQAIASVSLDASTKTIYMQDQISHPEASLYTLEPSEKFVLPTKFKNLEPFRATIFRGHFERGGMPIASQVSVNINQVIYLKQLNPDAYRPDSSTYLLFGVPKELFIAHLITMKPNFDQVLGISFTTPDLEKLLTKNLYLKIEIPESDDSMPLKGSGPFDLNINSGEQSFPATGTLLKEYYLEPGDLS